MMFVEKQKKLIGKNAFLSLGKLIKTENATFCVLATGQSKHKKKMNKQCFFSIFTGIRLKKAIFSLQFSNKIHSFNFMLICKIVYSCKYGINKIRSFHLVVPLLRKCRISKI